MAKALQCPSCGASTRIDAVPDTGTVQCSSCRQAMKVPPGFGKSRGRSSERGEASSRASQRRPSEAPAASSSSPPTPPRRAVVGGAAPAAAGGGTAVLSQGAAPVAARPTASPPGPRRSSGSGAVPSHPDGAGRDAIPLALRIGVWILALPLGLLIVGIPARQLGYLSSQKLLDVIVKRDLGRFLPIVVVVALWALVTALLVTVFVEGGRRWMRRRQRKKALR